MKPSLLICQGTQKRRNRKLSLTVPNALLSQISGLNRTQATLVLNSFLITGIMPTKVVAAMRIKNAKSQRTSELPREEN